MGQMRKVVGNIIIPKWAAEEKETEWRDVNNLTYGEMPKEKKNSVEVERSREKSPRLNEKSKGFQV